jgi:hypothetical protein
MVRLVKPKLIYLKESNTFHYENRELPIYPSDEMCSNKGEYYCISHKKFLDEAVNSSKSYDDHVEIPQTHKLVWYCFTHARFEEV